MTPYELHSAFTTWFLAIGSKIASLHEDKSFDELAMEFGLKITTKEHLDTVSDCFDFEAITQLIEESHGTKKD
jgi:hypothetical protein